MPEVFKDIMLGKMRETPTRRLHQLFQSQIDNLPRDRVDNELMESLVRRNTLTKIAKDNIFANPNQDFNTIMEMPGRVNIGRTSVHGAFNDKGLNNLSNSEKLLSDIVSMGEDPSKFDTVLAKSGTPQGRDESTFSTLIHEGIHKQFSKMGANFGDIFLTASGIVEPSISKDLKGRHDGLLIKVQGRADPEEFLVRAFMVDQGLQEASVFDNIFNPQIGMAKALKNPQIRKVINFMKGIFQELQQRPVNDVIPPFHTNLVDNPHNRFANKPQEVFKQIMDREGTMER